MKMLNNLAAEQAQNAFGRQLAARLDESAQALPHDIEQRLKALRMQAQARRKVVQLQSAAAVVRSGGTLALQSPGDSFGWWGRAGAVLPLLALLIGLLSISHLQDERRIQELASVDTELLTDELPPAAYTDPGFAQFLRTKLQP